MSTIHEFDLDAPVAAKTGPALGTAVRPALRTAAPPAARTGEAPGARGRPGIGRGFAMLAMGLAGVGLGAVLAAAPSGQSDVQPVSATVAPLDITVAGRHAIAKLRLTMDNPGTQQVRATALTLDGVNAERVSIPLSAVLGPGSHQIVDVSVDASCTRPGMSSDDQRPFRIRLLVAGHPAGVQVLPASLLDRDGGLCALLDSVLPRGWDTPILATTARRDRQDLVLSVPGLKGQNVAGSDTASGIVNTSAYIGDRLVSATLASGTTLRLIGPAPCINGSDGDPIPMTLRVLAHAPFGLRQLLIQAGPAVARWVTQNCPD